MGKQSTSWYESRHELANFVEACIDEGMESKQVAHLISEPWKWTSEYHGWTERDCSSEWLGLALDHGVEEANEEYRELLQGQRDRYDDAMKDEGRI